MRMTTVDIKKYPKFSYYVKNDMPKIMNVHAIVQAMNKIGQINRSRLQFALTWGTGPSIKIIRMVGAYGAFTAYLGSNEIEINTKIVEDFEAGRNTKRITRAGDVYLVGLTLLHELVHWGDDQDGIDRPGEEGEEFEWLVYGV